MGTRVVEATPESSAANNIQGIDYAVIVHKQHWMSFRVLRNTPRQDQRQLESGHNSQYNITCYKTYFKKIYYIVDKGDNTRKGSRSPVNTEL